MAALKEAGLERALEIIKEVDFPSLPLYLQLIQREIKKREPSLRKIAELVSQDIGLTAKVLKVVNSPAYATRYAIDNILQAITTLGTETFFSAILEEAIRQELDQHILSASNFAVVWRHSSEVALACRTFAEICNKESFFAHEVDPNHAYLTGLFHDCGIPIMAARFPEYEKATDLTLFNDSSLEKMEANKYSTDHSIVSFIVTKMWELPLPVSRAIFCHHSIDFGYYKDDEERALSFILRMSETLIEEVVHASRRDHPFTAGYVPSDELYHMICKAHQCTNEKLVSLFKQAELALL